MPTFNLKKFRLTQTRLTQEEMALKLKCSRSSVSNIEVGLQNLSDKMLQKIGEAFDLDIEPYKSYNLGIEEENNFQNISINFEQLKDKYLKNLEEKNKLLSKYSALLEKFGKVYEANSNLQAQLIECELKLEQYSKK